MDALAVDVDLARALSENDRRRAGTLLVTHYASDVFALCRAIVRDRDVAEDLAQDAFQKALVALPSFRGESSARTWLLSIARNRCLDHLRSARSAPFARDDDGESDAHPSPEAPVLELLVRHEDVERALLPLDETERAIVVLFHGHGVGYPELAQAFGLREGALRMRMSRATAKMRAALETDGARRTGREVRGEELEAALELDRTPGRARGGRAQAAPPAVPRAAAPVAARISGVAPASATASGGAGAPRPPDAPAGPVPPAAPPAPSRPLSPPPAMAAPGSVPLGRARDTAGPAGAPPAAPRAQGAPPPAPEGAAPAAPKEVGLLGRLASAVFGGAPAPASVTAAPAVPTSPLLHEDAPSALVERLLALAAAQ